MTSSVLNLIQNSQYSQQNVQAFWKGKKATAPANCATNIDFLVTDDCFFQGARLLANTPTFGDSVKFQVVDVDNILGGGAGTVLATFIDTWYLRSDSQDQLNEMSAYPSKILGGLYLRIVYSNTSLLGAVTVAINYRLQKALY